MTEEYNKECKYCGKIHDSRVCCPSYPKANKEMTEQYNWEEEFDQKFYYIGCDDYGDGPEVSRFYGKQEMSKGTESNMLEIKLFVSQLLLKEREKAFTATDQGATCCPDGHQTFYGAITKSPQWQEWYKEQMNRLANYETNNKPCFDVDESMGIGAISDKHLQEFFKFICEVETTKLLNSGKKMYQRGREDEKQEMIEKIKTMPNPYPAELFDNSPDENSAKLARLGYDNCKKDIIQSLKEE